jgi:hypothetical protein
MKWVEKPVDQRVSLVNRIKAELISSVLKTSSLPLAPSLMEWQHEESWSHPRFSALTAISLGHRVTHAEFLQNP